VVSRHLHNAAKQDSKAFIFRDIIKNKEIANRRVGFKTRNASQSIWVRHFSSHFHEDNQPRVLKLIRNKCPHRDNDRISKFD